jgi:hypothetical protein
VTALWRMSIVLEHEPIGEADRTSLSAGSAAASSTAPAGSVDLLSVPPHQVVLEEIMSILASVFCINPTELKAMHPPPKRSKPKRISHKNNKKPLSGSCFFGMQAVL